MRALHPFGIIPATIYLAFTLLALGGCNRAQNPVTPAPAPIVEGDRVPTPKALPVKTAATPEEAFNYYVEAVQAQDVDAVLAQLRGMLLAHYELERAADEIRDALKEKHGKDFPEPKGPNVVVLSARRGLAKLKDQRYEIRNKNVVSDNVVELTVWEIRSQNGKEMINERPWFAVKEATGWKLDAPMFLKSLESKEGPEKNAQNQYISRSVGTLPADWTKDRHYNETVAVKRMMTQVTQEIRDGKHASFEAIEAEMQRRHKEYSQQIENDEN